MNGTAALHASLVLAGVSQNDEVLTQALTFIATTNAISYTGAQPVFIDVDRETMGLSPTALKAWLTENTEMRAIPEHKAEQPEASSLKPEAGSVAPFNKTTNRRIAACVPMHTFGHPCKIDEIAEICAEYNIPLVEDAAESIGSYYSPYEISEGKISRGKGKHTGLYGEMGILSFNGNKIITTGGGGMIITNNEELAKKAKHLTTTGKIPHRWEFNHDITAYNYRLTNLAAALGCAQIESLDFFVSEKRKLAEQYAAFFASTGIQFFTEPEHCKSNYWLNAIIMNNKDERDTFLQYTNDHNVMTRPIWNLMNRLPMYAHCQHDSLGNSIWLADRVVNIPSSVIVEGYRR